MLVVKAAKAPRRAVPGKQVARALLAAVRVPAPVQAVVIPVADRHLPYASKVRERLKEAEGLRVEVDDAPMSMQKKIRENARQKVPYLLIVGDAEEVEARDEAESRDIEAAIDSNRGDE